MWQSLPLSPTTADNMPSAILVTKTISQLATTLTKTLHRCEELTAVLHEIDEGIQRMSSNNVSEDTREELFFVSDQSKQSILAWKAHLLRSINQDDARLDVLDSLDETSVLLIEDWAMKFLPRKYCESQTDWFGKRGISWHLTVATRRMAPDQDLGMMTFSHVFQSCNQDSSAHHD